MYVAAVAWQTRIHKNKNVTNTVQYVQYNTVCINAIIEEQSHSSYQQEEEFPPTEQQNETSNQTSEQTY